MKKNLKKENFYKIPLIVFIFFILIKIKPMNNGSDQYLKNIDNIFSIETIIEGAPSQFNKKIYIKEKQFTKTLENKFIKKIYIFDDDTNKSFIYIAKTNQGYNGKIFYSVAIDALSSKVIALKVLEHNESRGLDKKLDHLNKWQTKKFNKNFKDLNSTDWALTKKGGAFDGLTGATITQEALLKSISKVLKFHRKENL